MDFPLLLMLCSSCVDTNTYETAKQHIRIVFKNVFLGTEYLVKGLAGQVGGIHDLLDGNSIQIVCS